MTGKGSNVVELSPFVYSVAFDCILSTSFLYTVCAGGPTAFFG
jgi:hypothetical protein